VVQAAGIAGSGGSLLSPAPQAPGSTELLEVALMLLVALPLPATVEADEVPVLPAVAPAEDELRPPDEALELLSWLALVASPPPEPHAAHTIAHASAPIPVSIPRSRTIASSHARAVHR